jgi:hypothetical protein
VIRQIIGLGMELEFHAPPAGTDPFALGVVAGGVLKIASAGPAGAFDTSEPP